MVPLLSPRTLLGLHYGFHPGVEPNEEEFAEAIQVVVAARRQSALFESSNKVSELPRDNGVLPRIERLSLPGTIGHNRRFLWPEW